MSVYTYFLDIFLKIRHYEILWRFLTIYIFIIIIVIIIIIITNMYY